jgi:hypothetical protein
VNFTKIYAIMSFQITKLKSSLDIETTLREEFSQTGGLESTKMMNQSDQRVKALSVLLLHYCTGLQHAQEQINTEQNNTKAV